MCLHPVWAKSQVITSPAGVPHPQSTYTPVSKCRRAQQDTQEGGSCRIEHSSNSLRVLFDVPETQGTERQDALQELGSLLEMR